MSVAQLQCQLFAPEVLLPEEYAGAEVQTFSAMSQGLVTEALSRLVAIGPEFNVRPAEEHIRCDLSQEPLV